MAPDALGLLVEALDDPEVVAAFARQMPRPEAWSWVIRELESAFPDSDETPPWITFEAPFSIMRKTAWEEHPFFVDAWGSEDTEWGHWARDNGKKVRYIKDSRVMHSHNHNLKQLYGRLFCDGEAAALIMRDKESALASIRRCIMETLRDSAFAIQRGNITDLPYLPIRRYVMHRAYYQGHKLGEHRLETGNTDPTIGQKIILKRYNG
jgi:rhamnosyltransferase